MKNLVKINNHYHLLSKSEFSSNIQKGAGYYAGDIRMWITGTIVTPIMRNIIASTNPELKHPALDMDNINDLLGLVDVKDLAESVIGTEIGSIRGSTQYDLNGDTKVGFIKGYNHCLKNNKYTREDLNSLLDWYTKLSASDKVSVWSKDGSGNGIFNMDSEQLVGKFLQKHPSEQTSWEVAFEENVVMLGNSNFSTQVKLKRI